MVDGAAIGGELADGGDVVVLDLDGGVGVLVEAGAQPLADGGAVVLDLVLRVVERGSGVDGRVDDDHDAAGKEGGGADVLAGEAAPADEPGALDAGGRFRPGLRGRCSRVEGRADEAQPPDGERRPPCAPPRALPWFTCHPKSS